MTDRYDADKNLKWIYPWQEKPQRSVKLALLTKGHIQTTGEWTDDGRFVAWQRLFTRNKEEERRHEISQKTRHD